MPVFPLSIPFRSVAPAATLEETADRRLAEHRKFQLTRVVPPALFRLLTEATARVYAGGALSHLVAIVLGWLIKECLAAGALYAEVIYPRGALMRERNEVNGPRPTMSVSRENRRPRATPKLVVVSGDEA